MFHPCLCFRIIGGQIFIGMITLQHKAKQVGSSCKYCILGLYYKTRNEQLAEMLVEY